MNPVPANPGLTWRLVDSLYVEAMVLADEARGYFDEPGRVERDALPPLKRVTFSCESLKVTTRLMHVIAWLLTRRAVDMGELTPMQARSPTRRLGRATPSDTRDVDGLPETARGLIAASRELYDRIERIEGDIDRAAVTQGPARGLMLRLENAF